MKIGLIERALKFTPMSEVVIATLNNNSYMQRTHFGPLQAVISNFTQHPNGTIFFTTDKSIKILYPDGSVRFIPNANDWYSGERLDEILGLDQPKQKLKAL